MRALKLGQNDTLPILRDTLYDPDGKVAILAGATVLFKMRAKGSQVVKISSAAVITDAQAGTVQYVWASGDLDTVGEFEAQWEVTYSGGGVQTYPNDEYIPIIVVDDV